MKILKNGILGGFAGQGSAEMPGNGEVFIDARELKGRDGKKYLVTCCNNCGDYSFVTKEDVKEFIDFLDGKTI